MEALCNQATLLYGLWAGNSGYVPPRPDTVRPFLFASRRLKRHALQYFPYSQYSPMYCTMTGHMTVECNFMCRAFLRRSRKTLDSSSPSESRIDLYEGLQICHQSASQWSVKLGMSRYQTDVNGWCREGQCILPVTTEWASFISTALHVSALADIIYTALCKMQQIYYMKVSIHTASQ